MSTQPLPRPAVSYETTKTPQKPAPQGRERFEDLRDEGLRDYVRSLPCLACTILGEEQREPTEAAHVTTKGSGGGDHDNLYPSCGRHHRWQHNRGLRTIEYILKRKLKVVAKRITAEYIGKVKHG